MINGRYRSALKEGRPQGLKVWSELWASWKMDREPRISRIAQATANSPERLKTQKRVKTKNERGSQTQTTERKLIKRN